ncbi:MAG: DoxX family membrane protein [Carboxylicivirga sp.]|jgi:thiosulfate dehydrogenase [quinone] large subunit|nr:DoxX family membrane protein [Carboxylicivirga sp.]MCT4648613.1 DoxX family membrane protein [Carboxylicivirga sp.]
MNHNKSLLPYAFLRVAIGWLFLHEGINKLLTEGWTSKMYLAKSTGPLKGIFEWLTEDPTWMNITDYTLSILLVAVGATLMIGLVERISAITGIVLLILFYLAYPPLGDSINSHAEGNYLLIDKNLIIALALYVSMRANSAKEYGMQRLLIRK